jgi:ligand-binding sensor protein
MKLTDVLPVEKWVELEKDIYEKSGLDSNVFNAEGFKITDFKNWVNNLCPAVKANDSGQSFICAVANINISAMAKQTKKPVIEECDAGLLKLIVPIFIKGEFLGAVGGCGVLLDSGKVDSFMINRITSMEEKDIENLTVDLKKITREEAENIGEYITGVIKKIAADFDKQACP